MKPATKTQKQTPNYNGDYWILGLMVIIVFIIVIIIFNPKHQKSIDKFINLDLKVQNPAGIYSTANEPQLTKWNADANQTLQLSFTDIGADPPIGKVKMDFKDTENNNLYTYSSEDPAFIFKLNLPPARTYMLYIYLNNAVQPTFMTYLTTSEHYFNFTDANGNEIPRSISDPILRVNITNPDNTATVPSETADNNGNIIYNLGTLNMQPYNIIKIPVQLPNLVEYKNAIRATQTTDAEKTEAHNLKVAGLDKFVFKEIEARVSIIGLPTDFGGARIGVGTGISSDNMNRFYAKYPVPPKIITPGVDNCINPSNNSCSLQIRNCVNDTTYRVEFRTVYQQLGVIEQNIRYTRPQFIDFTVSSQKNEAADMNKIIKINDIGQQYIINRAQRDFIKTDQQRQDNNMMAIEADIKNISNKIYSVL